MKAPLSRILILFLSLIFFIQHTYSIELNFKNYSVENGLPSNTIFTIIQDSKDFIWIGTEDGLSRFNGYEFRNYRRNPKDNTSLINNHVYCLLEDYENNIWIGTEEGVCKYIPSQNNFVPFDMKASNGVRIEGRIQNIITDENKDIWIGVYLQGVFCYNRKEKKLTQYTFNKYTNANSEPNNVTCIYKDKENNILASVNNTRYQIYKIDKKQNKFIPLYPNTNAESLAKLSAYCMLEDNFGTLWFGTWNNGLCAINKKNGAFSSYLNTEQVDKILHIHSITEYEPGKLLIGSNDGLTIMNISPILGNKREKHFTDPFISDRFVYPIFKDAEGGLWIGTYYGGINYASPNRNYFARYVHDKYENSVSGNVMSSFCEDKQGNIWIGTDDGGLNCFNPKNNKFEVFKPGNKGDGLSYHNIHGLCVDDDNLWIGTYTGGLNKMNLKTKTFKHYKLNASDTTTIWNNSIYSIHKDSESNIWVGTTAGICLYNREKDSFHRMKKLNTIIIDILQVENNIWFATIGEGLLSFNLSTKKWNKYKFSPNDNSSLVSNDVICLCTDESKRLWIGTNNGICLYDKKNNAFTHIPINTKSQSIRAIFNEYEQLWITTTKGLVRYDINTKQSRLFTESDGLLSDEFTHKSGLKASNGRIYIGTAKGFNAFFPKQIETNRYIPTVELVDFQLFNKSVDVREYMAENDGVYEIVLPYKKNAFSFEYTALSYFAPEKNEYVFMLENFDHSWNYVGNQRKATYTNIPPGEYYFKVKASNNDGIWNDTGLTIKVTVKPPIWLTIWAFLFYILVIAGIIVWTVKYLKKRNEKKNNERIEKIKNEKEKEAYDSKINFFTTIAHEIRTPVSLIIAPLEKILDTTEQLPSNITSDLKIIDRNSQRLLFLTNQLLDFRKIEKEAIQINPTIVNLNNLLSNIYIRFSSFVEHRNIKFSYICDNPNFCVNVDVENLTKAVSNLLNNASKFTKDFIELKMESTDHKQFKISVTDNGEGIPKELQETIFTAFYQVPNNQKVGTGLGLYLVKSIVTACKGSITIDSTINVGSTFTITLPNDLPNETSLVGSDMQNNIIHETSVNISDETLDIESKTIENNGTKKTLLIVEDNADLQLFLYNSLSGIFNILQAYDGKEGLEILEKHEVEVIISDIMMDNMNGIEFCNIVKRNFLWDHIPFILLTAKTNLSAKIEALETGADVYIEKPFSIAHIIAQIKNLLESRQNLLKKFSETPFVSLKSISGNKNDEKFLNSVHEIISQNLSNENFTIDNLADKLHISNSGLFSKIKTLTGMTPNKLLILIRLKKAAELLSENRFQVNEVCYMVGFNNPSYFAKCFYKQYNILPKNFLKDKNSHENIENPDKL